MTNHPSRRRVATQKAAKEVAHNHDHDYSALLSGVIDSFKCVAVGTHLFTTDAKDLNKIYLDNLPEEERQIHNCHACRQFLERYGNLVAIRPGDGTLDPVIWIPSFVPDVYAKSFKALRLAVQKSKVTGVFLTDKEVWGTPITDEWSHMSVHPDRKFLYRGTLHNTGQAMAVKKENFRVVLEALSEFKPALLDEALRVLKADVLARSEKFIAPLEWLRQLHDRPKGREGTNLLWQAIAVAPEGYCHPRASVTGSLLEDIAAGLPFEDVKARFNAKVGPLIYQRPQVAPSAGNIKAAEVIVEKLGIARSLERRFARLEDLQEVFFLPTDASSEEKKSGSIFGHLKPKNEEVVNTLDISMLTVTWDKFSKQVLPTAERLEIGVPRTGTFIALTAAQNEDAPPIIKWDREEARNSVAWYVYPYASPALQWRLKAGEWRKINAVVNLPNMWGDNPSRHLGEGVVLIIDGAVDTREDCGNSLFPDFLKQELHSIRSTIEAYSKSATFFGREEATACGYDVRKGGKYTGLLLRVFSNGGWIRYEVDRWD